MATTYERYLKLNIDDSRVAVLDAIGEKLLLAL